MQRLVPCRHFEAAAVAMAYSTSKVNCVFQPIVDGISG